MQNNSIEYELSLTLHPGEPGSIRTHEAKYDGIYPCQHVRQKFFLLYVIVK
jgi:hypothetical protein